MSKATQHNTSPALDGQSTPIVTYHRAIDQAIDKLLAFKAQLIRAQLAGLQTVDLADPDTDQVYTVALSLAIEAVEFVASVKGGAA